MEVILTHEHADFDALSSLLAAARLFPEAHPVLPHRLNRNLRDFLVLYRSSLPFLRPDELPREPVDLAILVDTQTAQAVRGMTHHTPVRVIDHHEQERDLPQHYHYWGEPVGATTTLLLEQIIKRGITIKPIEATLLLLGIYEDTGGLSYTSTTARDMRCAAWLLEQGANLEVVNDFLHHPLTTGQQRLLKQLSDRAETLQVYGHTIVVATAAMAENVEEISTLAHKLRDLFDPDGLFLLVDLQDRVQLVARSTTDHIDVGAIAAHFGGGGHPRAAAALIRGQSLDAVRADLLIVLQTQVRPAVTVGQIMSWGVNALPPGITVAEASERMHRLGHEGFPVVEDGALQGLVTRRVVDRAMHHNLHKRPVAQIMRAGQVSVQPEDSVQTLQQRMMETGWGQIPVVDEAGLMVGIVTRTDLLKLWGTAERELSPRSVARQMDVTLPQGLLELMRCAGHEATRQGFPLYAAGGFVRDLLLGRPNFDLDLVVEGDAAVLARALARQHGGRVRTHKRFGTAKWIRDDAQFSAGQPMSDGSPSSLDFATARTEFYEEATALPVVERSSIKLDLHRRDFTINTLAIGLDDEHWGELLDFYGGQSDLEAGIVRVLHSLSFIEDPTRILRAVRFEQRFGFRIEERTAELIADALDTLPRLSGARIRHELNLILQEHRPEAALQRLHELDVLRYIDPALSWQADDGMRFQSTRAALQARSEGPPTAIERLYFVLWLYRGDVAMHRRLIERLQLSSQTRALLEECQHLRQLEASLTAADLPASRLDELLARFSEGILLIASVENSDPLLRQRIEHYVRELRPAQISLDGEDLKAMGVKPGPVYRSILAALRAARLDGHIHTAAEERAYAQRLLEQEEH